MHGYMENALKPAEAPQVYRLALLGGMASPPCMAEKERKAYHSLYIAV
jgi:hypothetical protein